MPQNPPHSTLCIELLGGFRISCGPNEIRDDGWRLAKARSLVKIIVLAPGHSILRDQLLELLWPELDPDSGSNNLHQALHIARRTLGSLIPDAKPNDIIRLRRGVISLEPPVDLCVDLFRFEEQASSLLQSRNPADYYAVLDLYRGDLLPDDLYEDWTFERRLAVREQYVALLDRLANLHIARQEATPAIDVLRRIVAIEPDQEEAHRSLMELYARTGRRQQALRQYERLRDILERELELEPEPETDELYEAIQSGEFPTEPWDAEPQNESVQDERPEIGESIADFMRRAGDFVGRSAELQRLQQALQRVIGGRGEVLLIAGEPGIGKTRMTEEFLRFANAQGVRTYWGRCYEGDGAPAYWPWVQIIRSFIETRPAAELRAVMGPGAADIARIAPVVRDHIPDLEDSPQLDPDGERFRLFDSMTTFLKNAAQRTPLALIIDDLHSADRSSLLMLEFLAREIAGSGLLIIGTYRHVEVDRSHPLTRTLGQLARQDVTERITLEGLEPADIDRYIELTTGREAPADLATAIHDQTEGNPFFVREIVSLLIDEERLDNPEDVRSWHLTIPPGIRETMALRTARLSETAYQVLMTASVAGRDFALPIVAQVAALAEMETLNGLEEALGAGLVNESPFTTGGFRFSHSITREAMYDQISHARRLRLHQRMGEVLEASPHMAEDDGLSDLAYHFAEAASIGSADRAVHYLQRVARQATNRIAYAESVDYLRRAVEIHSTYISTSDIKLCELLLELGESLTNSGESTAAQDEFEHAIAIAREHADVHKLSRGAIGMFDAGYYSAYWYQPFVNLLDEGLELLADDDWELRVQILSRLATALQDSPGESERMRRLSDEAVRLAREQEPPNDLPYALYARFLATWTPGDDPASIRDVDELISVAECSNDLRMTLMGYAWRTHILVEQGDFDSADQAIEAYGSTVAQSRQRHHEWAYRLRLAMRALMTGPVDSAERLMYDALEVGLRTWPEPARANYFQQLYFLRRMQGRGKELLPQAQELVEAYPDIHIWHGILANLYIDCGETELAERQIGFMLREGLDAIPKDYFWITNLALLAEASSHAPGLPVDVDALRSMLDPLQHRFVSPGANAVCFGPVSLFLARLAHAHGDWQGAEANYHLAIEESDRVGMKPAAAIARRELANLLQKHPGNPGTQAEALTAQAQAVMMEYGLVRGP